MVLLCPTSRQLSAQLFRMCFQELCIKAALCILARLCGTSVQAVGLQSAYIAEHITRICQETLSLVFLLADVIPAAFAKLEGANTDVLVDQHLQYVRQTSADSTVWPVSMVSLLPASQHGQSTTSLSAWSVYRQPVSMVSLLPACQHGQSTASLSAWSVYCQPVSMVSLPPASQHGQSTASLSAWSVYCQPVSMVSLLPACQN